MSGNADPGKVDRAVEALLTERSLFAAAKKADIPYSSFRRLLGDPEFQAVLREARTQVLDAALTRLRGLAEGAVEVVAQTMNGKVDSGLRFQAAKWVLEHGIEGMVADFDARVRKLEEESK